ncbi:hypothetical protein SELMODRAFT_442995 [Selaginella moellendorffii]|uniref:SOUL heme-binding protein n=2 Tax=Selaginella moellendorffii TaxID=88036 RepID=D8RYN2_SELML|nr:hypothetical protein SELMODRAFT_442995 [Selaginella moellendorffii]
MEWRGGAPYAPDRAASGAESDASPSLGKRKTPSELRREQLKRANSQDAGSAQRPDAPKPPRFSETRASDVCAPTKSAEKPKFSLSKYKDEHSTKGKEIKQNQGEASTSNSKFKNVAELSCRIQQPQASPAVDMAEAIKALAVIKAPEKVPRPISRSSSAPAEFDNQRTKKLPVLPLDLTLKLTARFLSCTSFHWCHRFGVQNQFQGLKQFIQSGLGVENPHGHKASEVESDFWKGLHSWVYPQLSFPPEVLSALMSPAARAGSSFLEQRQRDWEDSFHSLYYAFRNKLCNIFYFCGSQFVVAFLCGRSQEQICAYLSRSTRGLRALLQKQFLDKGVSFSMPLCKLDSKPASAEELQELSAFEKLNPGQTRLVDSMAAVDNSVQSLLAFNGSQSVHRLYDFLLNYSKQMQVIDGSAVSTNNSYSLEIKATCLAPWVISRLCVALRRLHKETFEVSFTTEPLSEGLNIAQLHEEAACNELGFGLASTFASGSIRQIKCIDGSYVATILRRSLWQDRMARLVVVFVALTIASSAVAAPSSGFEQVVQLYSAEGSESCGPKLSIETPHCKIEARKNGYELRKYPEGQVWVETLVANSSYSAAVSVGFYRLFYYISGKNEKGEVIEMTAPVLVHPYEERGGYKVSFYAPSRFKSHKDLPKPMDKNVKFLVTKEHTYAVSGPFGGFPTEPDYEKRLKALKEALDKDDVEYNGEKVYYAGYSSPFEFVNRKQEVHLLTK